MKTQSTPARIRTNSKIVREAIRAHILENVTNCNGDTFTTIEDARVYLRAEFERVAGYALNMKRFPNNQDRFHNYLMGLPFGFEYTHNGIAGFLNGLGLDPTGKEYDREKSARLYSGLIFREIA